MALLESNHCATAHTATDRTCAASAAAHRKSPLPNAAAAAPPQPHAPTPAGEAALSGHAAARKDIYLNSTMVNAKDFSQICDVPKQLFIEI